MPAHWNDDDVISAILLGALAVIIAAFLIGLLVGANDRARAFELQCAEKGGQAIGWRCVDRSAIIEVK
jgi:hypothetical protein